MLEDLVEGVKEIFQYKEMLKDVIFAAMNTPDYYLDKVFPIYEEMVELVESFAPFTLDEVEEFMNKHLVKYDKQPFFPVLGGLYLNALINKLFSQYEEITLRIEELCFNIIEDASQSADAYEEGDEALDVNFSLDFIGYLLPNDKVLVIKGPVGDFCGALMGDNSEIVLYGLHGKNLGYERAETSQISVHKS